MTTASELRFKYFDANNDGRIDRSDFQQEATELVRAFGADADSPHASALITSYEAVYDYIAGKAGAKDEGLSLTDFVTTSQAIIADRGDVGFSQVLRPYAQAAANLCDTDGDGKISLEEYDRWLTIIGASHTDAEESFKKIDTDNNGEVSIDEFVEAMRKYALGE